jgi:acylphosphatase
VQGVFFRENTREKAESLGLKGWVKNNPDGSVEAVFEGEEAMIEEIIEFCKKGPIGSRVIDIKINTEPVENLKNFEIRY